MQVPRNEEHIETFKAESSVPVLTLYLSSRQGDLSLLATGGGGGVPEGHILAYKADHLLHAKFLKALAAKAEQD